MLPLLIPLPECSRRLQPHNPIYHLQYFMFYGISGLHLSSVGSRGAEEAFKAKLSFLSFSASCILLSSLLLSVAGKTEGVSRQVFSALPPVRMRRWHRAATKNSQSGRSAHYLFLKQKDLRFCVDGVLFSFAAGFYGVIERGRGGQSSARRRGENQYEPQIGR